MSTKPFSGSKTRDKKGGSSIGLSGERLGLLFGIGIVYTDKP